MMIVLTGLLTIGGGAIVNNASATQESNDQIQISIGDQDISLEEAKNIALKEIQGAVIETYEEDDEYEIMISKDSYLYEVEIDKVTGKIKEIHEKKNASIITEEEAKQLALKEINGTIVNVKNDDDEITVEIEKDGYLYEIEINKEKGKIVEIEKEKIKNSQMTLEDAKKLALSKINGTIINTEIEDDEYQFEIEKDGYIYKVEIDREDGVVQKIKKCTKETTNSLTLDEAKTLALSKINGSIIETEIEDDEYKFEIEKDGHIYEIEIDREKGVIHSIEKHHDNH